MTELFIKNKANSCATISAWQWIQLSNMSYEQYKKMIAEVGSQSDVDVLNFIEPVVRKYWNQKDPMKFPQFEHAAEFKGINKARGKCPTCIPWKNGSGFEGVTDEYLAFDWWCRMMLRVEAKIDINDQENSTLNELWDYGLYGEKLTESANGEQKINQLHSKYMTQVNKYCKYMSKFTKDACIPFVCYEVVFYSDNKRSEYHAFITVCYKNEKNVELNSNLTPAKVDNCNLVCVRKTSGRWTLAPPKKVLFDFYDD